MKRPSLLVLVACAALCVAVQSQTFISFKIGSDSTYPSGLNASGEVVGMYYAGVYNSSYGFRRDATGTMHRLGEGVLPRVVNRRGEYAGLWNVSAFHQLPPGQHVLILKDKNSQALYLNDAGWLAGTCQCDGNNQPTESFVQDASGTLTILQIPGAYESIFAGLNNANQLIGYYNTVENGPSTGFLYVDGVVTPLNFPGAVSVYPKAINDSAEIVGVWVDAKGAGHAFYGTVAQGFTSFDVPGALQTSPWGINSSGTIVGSFFTSSQLLQGFMLKSGKFTTLNYPGAYQSVPLRVNNAGTVLGDWLTKKNLSRGFLWTP
ncbi:MAG TPA: hypothetical protein VN950_25860 [Terriglobales bacterium]|nr:hypothetical protein [Terriglobales bacterium]